MFKLFSEKKLMLAFEYGLVLADVASQKKIELTKEIVLRLENIMKKEFNKKNSTRLAVDMIVNILAALEPK